MSTTNTASAAEATPQSGSLESAAQAFAGLLSVSDKADTAQPSTRQPEQPKKADKGSSAEQAPAAPEGESTATAPESEQAPETAPTETNETDETTDAAPQPRTLRVKLPGGEEVEVTEDEAAAGYSRTQDYTKKTMELARQRKEFEEKELAAVRQERAQYADALGKIEQYLTDLAPKEPDWTQLRQTLSPEGFADAVTAWQENRTRLNAVQEERTRIQGQQAEETAAKWKTFVDEQRTKLIEADPDFGDPTKNTAINDELCAFAMTRGFTAQELAQTVDHRMVLLLRDAMRHAQQKAKAPTVKNKIEESIKTTEPGSTKANHPKSSKSDQALERLKRTGSVDDAAMALMDRI